MSNSGTDWPAPGPGTWELDTAHFDPTVSRPIRDMMEIAFERGLGEGFELAGAPLGAMNAAFVNGRFYSSMVPLVGGGRDLPLPPKPVMWVLTRLHPAFRRRAKQSVTAIDGRYWLQEFARWEREWKPKLQATNRRLGEVDVAALDAGELAAHLGKVWEHVEWAGTLHFRLHTSDLAPIGRLLVATTGWGLDPGEVMTTLAGSSPATSAPSRALAEIADEIGESSNGGAIDSLDDVRAVSDRAAELLDDYLAEFGNRVTTGYDIRNRTLVELPGVVLSSILNAARPDLNAATATGDRAFSQLSDRLDPADRAEFGDLVEQARTLYGLRDENGPITVEWPTGILRHAIVEAGHRLVDAGTLEDFEHVFDATVAELRGLLTHTSGPTAQELSVRCAERMSWIDMDPPAIIGPEPKLPDVDLLPGKMPEMMRAILMVTTLIDEGDLDGGTRPALTGTGVGTEIVRGIARVVADADEAFERADPGDIIVTRLTVPTFNAILAMSGGVVTEGGGLLSHTAVIARELGIAAVIGVQGALTQIPDGAEIELDPINGTVTLV